jgi:hypothetical protein
MLSDDSVFVTRLGLLNTLRILAQVRLRRAGAVHCKEAGFFGRFCLGIRIRKIPEHYYARYRESNFCDYRSRSTLELATDSLGSEPDRYLKRFLQQVFAWSVFDAIGLIQDSELVATRGGRSTVLIPFNPFLGLLRRRYETETRRICWGFNAKQFQDILVRLFSHGPGLIHALPRLLSPRARNLAEAGDPALSVLNFRGGCSIDARTDFFWLGPSDPDHPIIFEYGHTKYPLSSRYVSELSERGIRIVETHSKTREVPGSEQWRPGRIFLARSMGTVLRLVVDLLAAFRAMSLLKVWISLHTFDFQMQMNRRVDFYECYNIRAELLSGLTLSESAHSAALRELGGVTCAAQYSVAIDPLGGHTSTSTFHLHFGESVKTWDLAFQADFNILNGYTFKTPLLGGVDESRDLRRRLERCGVRRTVCFLDEGFEPDGIEEPIFGFYRYLLQKIVEEKDFGAVVKPKKNDHVDLLRSEFRDLWERAVKTGRFIVLDWRYYPGVAGLAADVTVGVMSTAAFETALLGARTIYLNPFGYLPAFLSGVQDNVFDSVTDTIVAVERILDGEDGAGLGLHPESFLCSIDALRDGDVSRRVQYLLSSCLDEIKHGASLERAVKATISGLRQRWPVQFV